MAKTETRKVVENKEVKVKIDTPQEKSIEDFHDYENVGDNPQEQPKGIIPNKNDIEFFQHFFQEKAKVDSRVSDLNNKRKKTKDYLEVIENEMDLLAKENTEAENSINNIIEKYKEIYERENECTGSTFQGFGQDGSLMFK